MKVFLVIGCLLLQVRVEAKDSLVNTYAERVHITLFIRQKTSRLQLLRRHVRDRAPSSRCLLALTRELRHPEVTEFEDPSLPENVDWFDVLVNDASLKKSNQSVSKLIEKIVDLFLSQGNTKLIGPVAHQRPRIAELLEDV